MTWTDWKLTVLLIGKAKPCVLAKSDVDPAEGRFGVVLKGISFRDLSYTFKVLDVSSGAKATICSPQKRSTAKVKGDRNPPLEMFGNFQGGQKLPMQWVLWCQ